MIEKQKIYNVLKAHREASGDNCSIEKPKRTWFSATKVEKTNDSSQFPDYKKLLHDYDTSRKELIPQLNYIGSQVTNDYLHSNVTQAKTLVNLEKEK